MKVNTTRSHAKAGMRRNGQTSDRPEEKLAKNIIELYLKSLSEIEEQKVIHFNERNWARVDIVFTIGSGQKYALRLQGPPHDELKAIRHDRLQYYYLQELGYIVVDFWYHKMPMLFLRNERKLSDEELKEAFNEIEKNLQMYGLLMRSFKLNQTELLQ